MPITINVGLNKKLGLPDFGSLGANCTVEFILPSTFPQDDLETFQRHVRSAYVAVHKPSTKSWLGSRARQMAARAIGNPVATRVSQPAMSNGETGNGNHGRGPSEKQLTYLRQLAGQVKGVGVRSLDTLAQKMFDKPVAGLSSLDASGLIDTLKAIKAGEMDLEAVLGGAAS